MSSAVCRVLFFASLRDVTGTDSLSVELAEPVSLAGLLENIAPRVPTAAMAALRAENVRVAVNQTFLSGGELVQPGDEVAFMPPVTGG